MIKKTQRAATGFVACDVSLSLVRTLHKVSQEAELLWKPDLAEVALEWTLVAMAAAMQHEGGVLGKHNVARPTDV